MADGEPSTRPTESASVLDHVLGFAVRYAALLAVVAPALLYFAGALYLTSFYTRFGLPETELHFDAPYVVQASFLPLLSPLFWLLIIASFCLGMAGRSQAPSLFHPIPTVQIVTLVFTVFGIKRFADFIHVPANVQWLFWGRRDFLFFLIGLGAFTVLWLGHRRRQRGLSPVVLSRSKRTLSFMVTFAVLAIGWQIATTGNWPYGWLQTTFLFVAVTYVIFHLVKDFWSWWRTRRKQEQVSREVVVHHKSGRSAGANLFWGMVGGLMFLLSASFAGSIEGRQTAAGCGYAKAIVFNPLPPKIDGNKTYWLTVHIGGIYYIREAPPGKADHAILVPESPSTVVALQPVSRPADCPL